MSKFVTEPVKQVMSDIMNDSDRKMRDSTAATFCGLPEKKQDACDVHYIFHTLSVNCAPTRGVRLGKEKTNARSHPLKVMFSSTADRDIVFQVPKYLKENNHYTLAS